MEIKKIISTFFVLLLLSNGLFIANFFWSLSTGVGFLDNFESRYNAGNTLYKIESHENALEKYNSALAQNPNYYRGYHNLGNVYYQIGDLENSVSAYESALAIQADPETQKNLEFVQNELKKAQQKQEQSKDQESGEGEENNKSESSQQPDGESQPSNGENIQGENTESGELSEQTKQILEQRAQEIEQSQDDLKKYYNKNYQQNTSQSLFDRIFDNSLLEDSQEKDW